MSEHILFSGCAATGGEKPVRSAAIALARALGVDLWEAPRTGCCGARADREGRTPLGGPRLTPLLALDHGQGVICLSPACRATLATQLTKLALDHQAAATGRQCQAPPVRDCVELLVAERDAGRLRVLPRRLSFLRAALHGTCHADHTVAQLSDGAAAQVPAADLATLVAAVGATVLEDVSVAGRCGETVSVAARCLALAAEAGAEVLVTPCVLCYGALRRVQRTLAPYESGRTVAVLHLTQLLALACRPGPIVWRYGAQRV